MKTFLFYPVMIAVITQTFANVLFLPRGQIYASFNHWTLHLPIETRTSWKFAEKLDHRIEVFKSTFSTRFAEHRQGLRSDLTQRLWGKFVLDSELLDREMNMTMDALQHLNPSRHVRVKRSLLPFVGDALSSLFGTATTTEIQDLLSRVNDLSDSQNDVLNVIDSTVTMVNQTIVDVSINRQTINRLTNVTNYLTNRLDILKDKFTDDYIVSGLESDMEAVFTDLIATTRDFRKSVMDLETIFSLTENSILPRSLLPPSRFAKILDDMQKALPRELALPFPPSDTDQYFSTSHTQTMRTAGGISVLVTIPLLSIKDHFSVFQIFNIPVPKTANNQNFVANYEIEKAKFVALSEDSMRFMLINDDDFQMYLRRRLPFCPMRRPVMNVLTSTMCIPALLTDRTDSVNRFCEQVIRVNQTTDPTAEYLGNGHWIVISVDPLDFEIRCKIGATVNSTQTVTTVAPLSLVKLDFGCAAFSNHLQLPTHYRTDSYLEPYQIKHLNMTLAVNDVWNHVNSSLSEDKISFNHAVKSLPPINMRTITLSALKQHINSLKYQTQHHYRTVTIPVVSVTTVALLVVIVLCIIKSTRCPTLILSRVLREPSRTHPTPDGLTADDNSTPDNTPDKAPLSPRQDMSPTDTALRPEELALSAPITAPTKSTPHLTWMNC